MSNANLTVLVIDDAASVQKLIKPVLRKELGFLSDNILEAYDGKKALNILRTNKVDLILAEWNIQGVSGIELLKKVRQDSALSSIPFVIVSSYSDHRYILEAVKGKVTQYIIKPFSTFDFSVKVKQALQSKKGRSSDHAHPAKAGHDLVVLFKKRPITSGKIISINSNGLLARLTIQRGITIYDQLDLKISFQSAGGETVNTISVELVKIEQVPGDTKKKSANFNFIFTETDKTQKQFLTKLKELLKTSA